MNRFMNRLAATALVAATALGFTASVYAQSDQQKLVDAADATLANFLRDPEMKWIQQNLPRAKAVMIAPEIVKAGFIVGGSGGRAIVVARLGPMWAGPSFYTMSTASVGFQAGVAVSKGLNSLLSANFKMGGDASVAAGPVGAGAKSDVVADLITFTRAKGVYGGINLDGTLVNLSDEWNKAYFGKPVLPPDILIKGTVSNKGADKLLAEVARAAGGK